MQETSQIAWSTFQDIKSHLQEGQPDFLLKLNHLDSCLRKIYEFFLSFSHSDSPILQKALDSALERAIALEQRVLEAESMTKNSTQEINSERQRCVNFIQQIQNLKQKTIPQLEEICTKNLNSAMKWKEKCNFLEQDIIGVNQQWSGKLNSIYDEIKNFQRIIEGQKQQIEVKNQQISELQNGMKMNEKRFKNAISEAKLQSSVLIKNLQQEIANLQGQVQSLGRREQQVVVSGQQWGGNNGQIQLQNGQIVQQNGQNWQGNGQNSQQNTQQSQNQQNSNLQQNSGQNTYNKAGQFNNQNSNNSQKQTQNEVKTTQNTQKSSLLNSSQPELSTSFIDEINVAMRKMRNEQVFMQSQPVSKGQSEVVDVGLKRINERLKKLGGKNVYEESEF